jgi:hypothetical protein
MKLTKIVTLVGTALAASASMAMAQTETTETTTVVHVWDNPHDWWGNHFTAPTGAKFTANELNFDLFASYVAPERTFTHLAQTDIRDGAWGGGVGLNYFLTRELGIGGDINMPNDKGNLVDSVSGSLIARFPCEQVGIAPYFFGGGGRTTDRVWDWTGHAGVGMEYRMNPLTGVFADARYIWGDKSSDAVLFRAGLRFIF